MSRATKYLRTALDFLFVGTIGVLLILLRYISRMSRVLYSVLPGEEHFYIWSYNNAQYKVYYKVSGPVDAPSLVLFHSPGIGASAYEMRHIMPELAHSYRVYAPDLLGFGLSDHPDIEYTSALYVALYADFLQSVVKRPALVVASGLSSSYSVVVAQESPALCARLVLLSPLTLFEDPHPSPWLALLLNASGLMVYATLTLPFLLRMVIARQHQLPYRQVSADELNYVLTSATQIGSHHAALALLNGDLQMNVATEFELLTQPVLFIQGTVSRSPLLWGTVQPPLLAQPAVQSEQVTVVPFADSGVRIHEERPAKIIRSITQWQDELSPEQTIAPVTDAKLSAEPVAESAEIAFDSGNIRALNIVDTVSESSAGEVAQDVPDPVGADAMQEGLAEREIERELEALIERTEAYCVKCREKREMQNARRIVTKNGRNAMEGTCPVCSTRLFRFIAR